MAKPTVILVGADKGGVGKTTVARTLLDYFGAHQTPTRAFDTESPRGTLKRFHPDLTEVVDVTEVADQMKIFDTLGSAAARVTVIDVRAGLLSSTLAGAERHRLPRIGQEGPDHLRGVPHPRPLDRLAQRDRRDRELRRRRQLFPGEEPHQRHHLLRVGPQDLQFLLQADQRRRRDLASPSSTRWPASRWKWRASPSCRSSPTRTPRAQTANYSFVLRGYVRHWLGNVWGEYDRVKLIDLVAPKAESETSASKPRDKCFHVIPDAAQRRGSIFIDVALSCSVILRCERNELSEAMTAVGLRGSSLRAEHLRVTD